MKTVLALMLTTLVILAGQAASASQQYALYLSSFQSSGISLATYEANGKCLVPVDVYDQAAQGWSPFVWNALTDQTIALPFGIGIAAIRDDGTGAGANSSFQAVEIDPTGTVSQLNLDSTVAYSIAGRAEGNLEGGWYQTSSGQTSFFRKSPAGLTMLPPDPQTRRDVIGMGLDGTIVGTSIPIISPMPQPSSIITPPVMSGLVWLMDGSLYTVAPPAGKRLQAEAISPHFLVGQTTTKAGDPSTLAFLSNRDGSNLQILPPLSGYPGSEATGVWEGKQGVVVVGRSFDNATTHTIATQWINGQPQSLQSQIVFRLGLALTDSGSLTSPSSPPFINRLGQIVTIFQEAGGTARVAFLDPVYPTDLRGDLDRSGRINGADLNKLFRIFLGVDTPNNLAEQRAADVNGDGSINGQDVLGEIQVYLGLRTPTAVAP